ncbi:MAG TPA: DUF4956 domain-containing protein [Longimicrobiales bacterium]|nr:DUF4956 domain-containing protein [Longimicrobiales bacterium]
MSAVSQARNDRRRLLGVLAYYVVMAGVVAALVRVFPSVGDALSGRGIQGLVDSNPFGADAPPAVGTPVGATPLAGGFLGTISMLGALAIMIPVTRIYMVTRRYRGFEESVVHTLLILPVAVTGIVMIVQHSVALAFSLAGIVAAVRFRTTLEDTKDAVYVFLAIGVGIASGVQALGLALVLSLLFNAVVLVLWATRFGNPYAAAVAHGGTMPLGDALVGPASATTRQVVGDGSLVDAASPRDLAEVLEQAARLERHLSEERTRKKSKRANVLILVHAPDAAAAQGEVEPILQDVATRWKLAEIVPGPGGGVVLEYLANLAVAQAEGALLDRIRHAPGGAVTAAELRSLKGLKGRG